MNTAPLATLESSIEGSSTDSQITIVPYRQVSETPSNDQIPKNQSRNPRIQGRKGHTKSRAGCYNCKRARIKCKENRPSCDHCAHRGLKCEWPDVHITQIERPTRGCYRASPTLTNLQFRLPVFSMQDFRLFNHFVQTAHPFHPLGNDAVWTHEIPSISSDHDFLLHAMLALAAADIARRSNDRHMNLIAISHRVKSIASLNKAIETGVQSFVQANAMLATCFALLFQSVFIKDGLGEYMSFIRGTLAIGLKMGCSKMQFLFVKVFGDENMELIGPALKLAPLVPADVTRAACRSLEKIGFLCTKEMELRLYGRLLSMARNLVTSSQDAYMELRQFYSTFMTMSQPDFVDFIDPTNTVGRILQAHFVAMQLIMTPITKSEQSTRKSPNAYKNDDERTDVSTLGWLVSLREGVPADAAEYFEWTMWIEKQVRRGKLYNGVY